jgi:bifunctional DNA-binding transcriptional regulator/antitoxin component of YhaV-PrlF toxin-antitoxin module
MGWLASKGALLWIPFGHSPDADLLAQIGGTVLRVQVKTSTMRRHTSDGHERWSVHVATNGGGGNQSWSGVAKRLDPDAVDYVFALVGDGRRWFIPARTLEGQTNITLGGQKYSEFEIEKGEPIMGLVYGDTHGPSRIDGGGGSADVGESGWTVNPVPLAEWVRIPPPPSSSPSLIPRVPVRVERTRVSANHQITIPSRSFRAAGLCAGDRLFVEAINPGEVRVTRIHSPAQLEFGASPRTEDSPES